MVSSRKRDDRKIMRLRDGMKEYDKFFGLRIFQEKKKKKNSGKDLNAHNQTPPSPAITPQGP